MTADIPLPGLATDGELAAGRRVVECDECHRPLTDRLARMWSLGRDCRHKRGLRDIRGPGRFEVEQEGLWGGVGGP